MVRLSEVGSDWMADDSVQITVSGEWLTRFGFFKDTKVVIDVSDKQIVIKPVDVDDT